MILTVTLNTSIDKAYYVDDFKIGEVVRVKKAIYSAGGKGLNVSRVLSVLGEPVIATGFTGGCAGKFIENELDNSGISHRFVHIEGETRSCINIIDNYTGIQTELLEPGPAVNEKNIEDFISTYEELIESCDLITLSGSAPNGVEPKIYAKLIDMGKTHGKKVILDTSGEYLKGGIEASPTLVKPNKKEAELLLNMTIENVEDAKLAAKKLLEMGVEISVISLGSKGAVLANGEDVLYAPAPRIKAVNTVSCGDAMIAGFAVALLRKYSIAEMLRLGVAVSAANAMTAETGRCKREDVERLLKNVSVSKI
ncbi:1-phosphofructokinase [Thermoanaerobacterium sp. DL9XJH110]|uniref:1-phosphofructokinase n=1 Tax=Thermoanaerobacterium sp. DL9XJH110 TaxID=3386643 RepID=UPI003BB690D3